MGTTLRWRRCKHLHDYCVYTLARFGNQFSKLERASVGTNQRTPEILAQFERAARDREAIDDATEVIEAWNFGIQRGLPLHFAPTIGAAIVSGIHWLQVHCPSCDVVTDVDLRVVRRDPQIPITGILTSLSCRRCNGKGPTPRVIKLARFPNSDSG